MKVMGHPWYSKYSEQLSNDTVLEWKTYGPAEWQLWLVYVWSSPLCL